MQKKYLIWALWLVIFLAGGLFWLASKPWEETFFRPSREVVPDVTIEQSIVTFWQNGQKSGSFKADKIIVGKNDQKYLLQAVKDGVIFDADKPVVTDFSARSMSTSPGRLDFEAKKEVSGLARMDDETIAFKAGQADYQEGSKTASLGQKYSCSFSDARISGQDCQIDLDQKNAFSQSPFSLEKGSLTLQGLSYFASFSSKTLSLTGPVQGEVTAARIKPGEKPLKTKLSFTSATFYWKDKKASLAGEIKVIQEETTLLADEGLYNETDQTLQLTKNVRLATTKGQTRSDSALISLAEKNIQLEGAVQADLKIKLKK